MELLQNDSSFRQKPRKDKPFLPVVTLIFVESLLMLSRQNFGALLTAKVALPCFIQSLLEDGNFQNRMPKEKKRVFWDF